VKAKRKDCEMAGAAVLNLLEKNIKPRDIMTRKAFENAITTCPRTRWLNEHDSAPTSHRLLSRGRP
jgi:hypothetical protein